MLLVWYLGVQPELQWVVAERYNKLQTDWQALPALYVGNSATRFAHTGLTAGSQYRYQVCAYAKDANGKAARYCTDPISAPVTRTLEVKAVLTIPVQFDIGYLTPARGGFQPCTGLTGYIGRIVNGKFQPSTWPNSLCAAGNVTITQTARAVNMTGKSIRLIVTEFVLSGTSGLSGPQVDVYELAFPNPNYAPFQVALGSSLVSSPSSVPNSERDWLTKAFAYGQAVTFTVQYEGREYQRTNCTYKTAPIALSCP